MRPTDFSRYISDFISRYLPDERGASANTITAYRDTFVLLLDFMEKNKGIGVEKLELGMMGKETIVEFLDWIQRERNCGNSTRNARLAAIHSFYRYLQYQELGNLHECQRVLSIRTKKAPKGNISYITVEGMRLLLEQPDMATVRGRRDLALLSLMYDIGARVQEVIDLAPSSLRLGRPPVVKVIGKGNRARLVPMLDAQVVHLKSYMKERGLDRPEVGTRPLFFNSRGEKLTRSGVAHILQRHVKRARQRDGTLIPDRVSCHTLRHSKAMHLLQAGVNLVYIRDILGHVSVQTTEIYARADSRQKRKVLQEAYVDINPGEEPIWEKNEGLISWLKRF